MATKRKKVRVNLKMDGELARWLKEYASRNDTTMTALIVDGVQELRRRTGGGPPRVDQI